jgi:hypothetical protein
MIDISYPFGVDPSCSVPDVPAFGEAAGEALCRRRMLPHRRDVLVPLKAFVLNLSAVTHG